MLNILFLWNFVLQLFFSFLFSDNWEKLIIPACRKKNQCEIQVKTTIWNTLIWCFYRSRKNLMTFSEVACLLTFIILYFLLETVVVFIVYRVQDNFSRTSIFFFFHIVYGFFDLFFMVSKFLHLIAKLQIKPKSKSNNQKSGEAL